MTAPEPAHQPDGPTGLFADELIGLDPHDPEAKAFAVHLNRMRDAGDANTVEGYLSSVGNFADSANRLQGHRRLMAVIVVTLLLAAALAAAWETLITVVSTFGN